MGIIQPFSNKTKYSSLVIPAVLRLFLIIDTGTSSYASQMGSNLYFLTLKVFSESPS
jgi:hypothetical protein